MGYHTTEIEKGVLGESSKLVEELLELLDAEYQGCRLMALVEASDLYGALKFWAEKNGSSIDELKKMSEITERVFQEGDR